MTFFEFKTTWPFSQPSHQSPQQSFESGIRPRFLVYCNWLYTRYIVDSFLAPISLNFVVIPVGMTLETGLQQLTRSPTAAP